MNPGQGKRKLVRRLTAFMLGLLLTQALPVLAEKDEPPSYSDLLTKIKAGQVQRVEIYEEQQEQQSADVWLRETTNTADPKKKDKREPDFEVDLFDKNPVLFELLNQDKTIEVDIVPDGEDNPLVGLLFQFMFGIFLIFLLLMFLRRLSNSSSGPGQILNFGKSKARFHMEAETGVTFEDVAGIEEAKEELQEVVTFLKQPERFTAVGARIPRGALLVGPPGTGKTLLAKAIAGEAGVPFFSLSGSEFVEMFVGVGASRVRDLFKKAKESAPCIVFIDEIDAVGRQRGVGVGGGNDEREQTLNQLLTEMDGFEDNTGVIVIAATNRPDVLDNALLRPGRFDRQITVDLPDYRGRLGILEVHAKDKKIAEEVSLEVIARRTPGLSGAALANLLNEAAILTARRCQDAIGNPEIEDAIDRVTIGLTLTPHLDSKKKWLIAYHEVGHALLQTLLQNADPLTKVSILPSSKFLGFSMPTYDEERMPNRSWMLDRITIMLGGRAAEQEVFGDAEVTSGASSDLQKVAENARNMVTRLGMSSMGQLVLDIDEQYATFGGQDYSNDVALQIDHQVRDIVMDCYAKAQRLIRDNRLLVDKLVEILLERETIDGEEFREITLAYGQELTKKPVVPLPLKARAVVNS